MSLDSDIAPTAPPRPAPAASTMCPSLPEILTSQSSLPGISRRSTRSYGSSVASRALKLPRHVLVSGRPPPSLHAAGGSAPAAAGMPSYSTTRSGIPPKRKLLFMWSRSSSPMRRKTSAHERNDP